MAVASDGGDHKFVEWCSLSVFSFLCVENDEKDF